MTELTPYQRLGGETAVRRLVDRFYDLMDSLPKAKGIRDLHPADLTGSREKLYKFLSGWLGGPQLYIEAYGHPRLRARHLPFPITAADRDAWMCCMKQALGELEMDDELRRHLLEALGQTTEHMRNR